MNYFENMREPAVTEPHARNLWHGFRTATFLLVLLAAPGHAQLGVTMRYHVSGNEVA